MDNTLQFTLNVKNKNVPETLDLLVKNTSLTYKISDKYIFVNKKNVEKSREGNIAQQNKKTVSGRVVDEKGEPLPGATIVIEGTTKGVITDQDGFYSIEVNPTDKPVSYTHLDVYKRQTR